jgi:hypothetical protein
VYGIISTVGLNVGIPTNQKHGFLNAIFIALEGKMELLCAKGLAEKEGR